MRSDQGQVKRGQILKLVFRHQKGAYLVENDTGNPMVCLGLLSGSLFFGKSNLKIWHQFWVVFYVIWVSNMKELSWNFVCGYRTPSFITYVTFLNSNFCFVLGVLYLKTFFIFRSKTELSKIRHISFSARFLAHHFPISIFCAIFKTVGTTTVPAEHYFCQNRRNTTSLWRFSGHPIRAKPPKFCWRM